MLVHALFKIHHPFPTGSVAPASIIIHNM